MKSLELDKSIMPWLGKTGKEMSAFVVDKFKQHDLNLTIEQWILLKVLHDEDGRIQNDLAMITSRNKASLTRLIHTMEKNLLVARIPDTEDKRINRIFLTKNGRKTFESTIPVMEVVKKEIQNGLSNQEINTLIDLLQKVRKNIKNAQNSCITN